MSLLLSVLSTVASLCVGVCIDEVFAVVAALSAVKLNLFRLNAP